MSCDIVAVARHRDPAVGPSGRRIAGRREANGVTNRPVIANVTSRHHTSGRHSGRLRADDPAQAAHLRAVRRLRRALNPIIDKERKRPCTPSGNEILVRTLASPAVVVAPFTLPVDAGAVEIWVQPSSTATEITSWSTNG